MYTKFDRNLITGNASIDEHCKDFIERVNDLFHCCENGSGASSSVTMLHYLSTYLDSHFAREEALHQEIGYPGHLNHKRKHEEFRKKIDTLHEMLVNNGPTETFINEVKHHVSDWVHGHIKCFDCSVATFIHMRALPDLL